MYGTRRNRISGSKTTNNVGANNIHLNLTESISMESYDSYYSSDCSRPSSHADVKYSPSPLMRKAALKIKERRTAIKEEVEVEVIANHNGGSDDFIVHDGNSDSDDALSKCTGTTDTENKPSSPSSSSVRIPGTVLKYMKKCEQQSYDANYTKKAVEAATATATAKTNNTESSVPRDSRRLRLSNRGFLGGMKNISNNTNSEWDNSSCSTKSTAPATPPRAPKVVVLPASASEQTQQTSAIKKVSPPRSRRASKSPAQASPPKAPKSAPASRSTSEQQYQHASKEVLLSRSRRSRARALAPKSAPAPEQTQQSASKEVVPSRSKRDRAMALARTRKENNERKTMMMKQDQKQLERQ